MQPFTFHAPTRIIFGPDTAHGAADFLAELGGKKTLIITDANLIKFGLLEPILAAFKEPPIIFEEVPSDSDTAIVSKAAGIARAAGCDSILAIGGGSVIDTAKVVNICLTFGGDIFDYQGVNNLPSRVLPLLAIPTTAGTGSEVSLVAMIKDVQEKKKLLFGSRFLAPDVAILDPCMVASLPPKLTAATGLDALTHDLESYVALMSTSPFTDALCLESMKLLFAFLPAATADGADREARAATLVASTMAGAAFTNTGVGIVHALAHTTGARYGTHHGMTNAVFLPLGMEFNLEVCAGRYATAARFLGISTSSDDEGAARELIAAIRALTSKCGLSMRLKDLGIPEFAEQELGELAEIASTDPAIMFNPRDPSLEDITAIYKRAY